MVFLKLLALQFILLYIAGWSFFAGTKAIFVSGIILSLLNYSYNQNFGLWQLIIMLFVLMGILVNLLLDKKTDKLRVVEVTTGSLVSLLTAPIFFSFLPAFLLWAIAIGIPLGFTYRNISKYVYLQIFIRLVYAIGVIVIGNKIYPL